MGFTDQLRAFKREKVQALPARIVQETVREFASGLVTIWSPFGDPALWKAPPPADYVPGNFRSSWFLSIGQASAETTEATDRTTVNHEDLIDSLEAGGRVFLSNSAPHAGALETGHSRQAQQGIMVNAIEFEPIAYNVARRLAG